MKPSRRAAIGLEKRERTRAALIEAAYRVVARKNADVVTIDDIIVEAGVARGTFYNYFQTRDELLQAMAAFLQEEMRQKMGRQSIAISDPAERMAIAIRQLLHRSIQDKTWGTVIVRLGIFEPPANAAMEVSAIADLRAGLQLNRFQIDSFEAAIALTLGTGLMAARSVLAGHTEPDYPEQIAKIILKSLGIADAEAHAIAFKGLEPLQGDN
jgi:AcrR family transcriptional regulator